VKYETEEEGPVVIERRGWCGKDGDMSRDPGPISGRSEALPRVAAERGKRKKQEEVE